MTRKAKGDEPTVELRARAIECRMVGDSLTMEAVNFQLDDEGDAGEPAFVIRFDRGVKQAEAVDILRAVTARIENDSLPPVKVAVPSEIMDLIKRREVALQAILSRLDGLPRRVRDGVLSYMDQRLAAAPRDDM